LLAGPMKIIVENGHVVIARKRDTPEDIGKIFGW